VKVHPFIEAEEVAGHSVKRACGLLEVSKSAYYERKKAVPSPRELTDRELTEKITAVHAESDGTYGSPRVHKELHHRGVGVGRRRVSRLMRRAGLEGRCKKRWRKTTIQDPDTVVEDLDLVRRAFDVGGTPDARYCGDITYIPTWEGWAYLATVIDLASRRVVGWAVADHMRTELVTEALEAAFSSRRPPRGVVFHSDRGCQYTSLSIHLQGPPGPSSSPRRGAVARAKGRLLRLRGSSCRDSAAGRISIVALPGGLTPVTTDLVSSR